MAVALKTKKFTVECEVTVKLDIEVEAYDRECAVAIAEAQAVDQYLTATPKSVDARAIHLG